MINAEKYKDDIIDEYQNLLKEKVVDDDGNIISLRQKQQRADGLKRSC